METNMKKRLLKDLPFDGIVAGTVIQKVNGVYRINGGETYYESGGSSDNGNMCFNEKESSILDEIWENEKWFEEAKLSHIKFVPENNKITLVFNSIDIEDSELLAKGIIHILPELKKGSYAWKEFGDVTTSISDVL